MICHSLWQSYNKVGKVAEWASPKKKRVLLFCLTILSLIWNDTFVVTNFKPISFLYEVILV